MMPWIRSSRLTRLWIAANMVEPCDGAPPLRQAFSLMVNSSVSFRRPCLISLNTNSSVISLARLAGATRSSPPFSNSTLLLSGSSKSALGTLVWKVSSFLTVMFEAA